MRTYIPLNEQGKRAKALLTPVLEHAKRVREIQRYADGLGEDTTALTPRLQEARRRWQRIARQNERIIARSEALTPAQVMILTLRYVRGHEWPTIAQTTQMPRARLYQEHRAGLNGIDLDE